VSILELSLIYGLVAVGIFLSFRVLNFSDLTVDSSFTLGAAVFASSINAEWGLFSSLFLSIVSGAIAGLSTATLAIGLKLGDLLSSILVMYALYSVNFRIVGSSNLVMDSDLLPPFDTFFLAGLTVFLLGLLFVCLRSEGGLIFRAVGINESLLKQYGFPLVALKFFGLALSNGLVALGGGLFALISGFYDINIGTGTLIAGLASLVIGESISRRIGLALLLCVLGSLLFRLAVHIGFHSGSLGLIATDLNLITSCVIIAFILASRRRRLQGR